MIYRAKRLRAAGADRHDAFPVAHGCVVEQRTKGPGGEERHIAADYEGPLGVRNSEGSGDSADRAVSWRFVRVDGITEVGISIRIADQGDRSGRFLNNRRNVLREGCSTPRQQGFIVPHAGTLAAHQHESGVAHEKMVASHFEAELEGILHCSC